MSFYFAQDYGCCVLLPSLAVHEVRCPDPACGEVHGWLLTLSFLFWGVGITIWKSPPGGKKSV